MIYSSNKCEKQSRELNDIFRIGSLSMKMEQLNKAQEIYGSLLLEGFSSDDIKTYAYVHNRLAFIIKKLDRANLSEYHYREFVKLTEKCLLPMKTKVQVQYLLQTP